MEGRWNAKQHWRANRYQHHYFGLNYVEESQLASWKIGVMEHEQQLDDFQMKELLEAEEQFASLKSEVSEMKGLLEARAKRAEDIALNQKLLTEACDSSKVATVLQREDLVKSTLVYGVVGVVTIGVPILFTILSALSGEPATGEL
jgi:hypothetical protein